MALAFPNNPTEGQIFTSGSDSWYWTGTYWEVQPVTSPTFDDISVGGNLEVTGELIGIPLDKISDVNAPSPANGQVLAYDSAGEEWNAVSLSSTFIGGNVPNVTNFQNNTTSTTPTTGAVRITGGLGVNENLNVNGYIATDDYVNLKATASIRFSDSDSSNYVALKGPASVSSNLTWTLPAADGDSGQFLRTNGSGVLSWATVTGEGGGGGGDTPPGGSNTQVQFNDSGSFGGDSSFTFNSGTGTVTTPILVATGDVSITDTTASTNSTTGSIKTAGGVGIEGQLNVAGATNKFTGATASTSTTTGTVVVTGGVGISGEAHIGSTVTVGSTVTASTAPTATGHLTNKQYVDQQISAFSIAFGV